MISRDNNNPDVYELKSFVKITLSPYFTQKILTRGEIFTKKADFMYIIFKCIAWELTSMSKIQILFGEEGPWSIGGSILKILELWSTEIFNSLKIKNSKIPYTKEFYRFLPQLFDDFFVFEGGIINDKNLILQYQGKNVSFPIEPVLYKGDIKKLNLSRKIKGLMGFSSNILNNVIMARLPNKELYKKYPELIQKVLSGLKNIRNLIISVLVNSIIKGQRDILSPCGFIEDGKRIIFYPKMRNLKTPMFHLSELITHKQPLYVYYGKHFKEFSTYIFGLFAYLIKRDIHTDESYPYYDRYGLTVRFLKTILIYLGFTDPSLWGKLQHEKSTTKLIYKGKIEPIKIENIDRSALNDPDELFRKWIKIDELYQDVMIRTRGFLTTFVDTIGFIPVEFENKTFEYSNFRTSLGRVLEKMTDDFMYKDEKDRVYMSKDYFDKGVGGDQYSYMPLLVKYLNYHKESNTIRLPINKKRWRVKEDWDKQPPGEKLETYLNPYPNKKSKILKEMEDGITFYDVHKLAKELNFLLESVYDFSKKGKSTTLAGEIKLFNGIEFKKFDQIIKNKLPIQKKTPVGGKVLSILTLFNQLNETENLCMILENFYKMIDSRRWYFLEKDEKNNIFDILFNKIIIENTNIMKVIIMISNIKHDSEGDPRNSSKYEALLKIHFGCEMGDRGNSKYGEIVEKETKNLDEVKQKVDKLCLEVIKDLYPYSMYIVSPKVDNYSTYYIKKIILNWFIRNIFSILGLWGDKNKLFFFESEQIAKYKHKDVKRKRKKRKLFDVSLTRVNPDVFDRMDIDDKFDPHQDFRIENNPDRVYDYPLKVEPMGGPDLDTMIIDEYFNPILQKREYVNPIYIEIQHNKIQPRPFISNEGRKLEEEIMSERYIKKMSYNERKKEIKAFSQITRKSLDSTLKNLEIEEKMRKSINKFTGKVPTSSEQKFLLDTFLKNKRFKFNSTNDWLWNDEIIGDGNCQFRGIEKQLKRLIHKTIQFILDGNFIKKYKDVVIPGLRTLLGKITFESLKIIAISEILTKLPIEDRNNKIPNFKIHIEKLMDNKEWGEQVTLLYLLDAIHVQVRVLNFDYFDKHVDLWVGPRGSGRDNYSRIYLLLKWSLDPSPEMRKTIHYTNITKITPDKVDIFFVGKVLNTCRRLASFLFYKNEKVNFPDIDKGFPQMKQIYNEEREARGELEGERDKFEDQVREYRGKGVSIRLTDIPLAVKLEKQRKTERDYIEKYDERVRDEYYEKNEKNINERINHYLSNEYFKLIWSEGGTIIESSAVEDIWERVLEGYKIVVNDEKGYINDIKLGNMTKLEKETQLSEYNTGLNSKKNAFFRIIRKERDKRVDELSKLQYLANKVDSNMIEKTIKEIQIKIDRDQNVNNEIKNIEGFKSSKNINNLYFNRKKKKIDQHLKKIHKISGVKGEEEIEIIEKIPSDKPPLLIVKMDPVEKHRLNNLLISKYGALDQWGEGNIYLATALNVYDETIVNLLEIEKDIRKERLPSINHLNQDFKRYNLVIKNQHQTKPRNIIEADLKKIYNDSIGYDNKRGNLLESISKHIKRIAIRLLSKHKKQPQSIDELSKILRKYHIAKLYGTESKEMKNLIDVFYFDNKSLEERAITLLSKRTRESDHYIRTNVINNHTWGDILMLKILSNDLKLKTILYYLLEDNYLMKYEIVLDSDIGGVLGENNLFVHYQNNRLKFFTLSTIFENGGGGLKTLGQFGTSTRYGLEFDEENLIKGAVNVIAENIRKDDKVLKIIKQEFNKRADVYFKFGYDPKGIERKLHEVNQERIYLLNELKKVEQNKEASDKKINKLKNDLLSAKSNVEKANERIIKMTRIIEKFSIKNQILISKQVKLERIKLVLEKKNLDGENQQEKILNFNKELAKDKKVIQTNINKIKNKEKEINTYKKDMKIWKDSYKIFQKNYASLIKDNVALKNEKDLLSDRIKKLQYKLKTTKTKLNNKELKIENLEILLKKCKFNVKKSEEIIKRIKDQKAADDVKKLTVKSSGMIEMLKGVIGERDKVITDLKIERVDLEKDLKTQEDMFQEFNLQKKKDLKGFNIKKIELNVEIEAIEKKSKELQLDVEVKNTEIKGLKKALLTQSKKSIDDNKGLKIEIRNLNNKLSKESKRIKKSDKNLEKKKEEIIELKIELEKLKKNNKTLSKLYNDLDVNYKNFKFKTQNEINQFNNEKSDLNVKIKFVEKKIKDSQLFLTQKNKEIAILTQNNKSLKDEKSNQIKKSTNNLEKKNEELIELKKELKNLKEAGDRFSKLLDNLEKEFKIFKSKTKKEIKQFQEEIKKLKKALSNLKSEIQLLKKENKRLKNKINDMTDEKTTNIETIKNQSKYMLKYDKKVKILNQLITDYSKNKLNNLKEINKLKDELEEKNNILKKKDFQLKIYIDNINDIINKKKENEKKLNDLEDENKSLKDTVEELNADDKNKRIDLLLKIKESLIKDNEELDNKNEKIIKEKETLLNEIDSLTNIKIGDEKKINKKKSEILVLENKLKELANETSEFMIEIEDQSNLIDELDENNKQLVINNREILDGYLAVEAKAKLEIQKIKLQNKNKIEEKNSIIENLKRNNKKCLEQLKKLKKSTPQLSVDINEEIEKLQNQINNKQDEITKLQKEILQINKKNNLRIEEIKLEKEKALNNAEKAYGVQIKQLIDDKREIKLVKDLLSEQNAEHVVTIEDLKKKIIDIKKELDNSSNKLRVCENRIKEFEKQIVEYKKNKFEGEKKLVSLKKELKNVKNSIKLCLEKEKTQQIKLNNNSKEIQKIETELEKCSKALINAKKAKVEVKKAIIKKEITKIKKIHEEKMEVFKSKYGNFLKKYRINSKKLVRAEKKLLDTKKNFKTKIKEIRDTYTKQSKSLMKGKGGIKPDLEGINKKHKVEIKTLEKKHEQKISDINKKLLKLTNDQKVFKEHENKHKKEITDLVLKHEKTIEILKGSNFKKNKTFNITIKKQKENIKDLQGMLKNRIAIEKVTEEERKKFDNEKKVYQEKEKKLKTQLKNLEIKYEHMSKEGATLLNLNKKKIKEVEICLKENKELKRQVAVKELLASLYFKLDLVFDKKVFRKLLSKRLKKTEKILSQDEDNITKAERLESVYKLTELNKQKMDKASVAISRVLTPLDENDYAEVFSKYNELIDSGTEFDKLLLYLKKSITYLRSQHQVIRTLEISPQVVQHIMSTSFKIKEIMALYLFNFRVIWTKNFIAILKAISNELKSLKGDNERDYKSISETLKRWIKLRFNPDIGKIKRIQKYFISIQAPDIRNKTIKEIGNYVKKGVDYHQKEFNLFIHGIGGRTRLVTIQHLIDDVIIHVQTFIEDFKNIIDNPYYYDDLGEYFVSYTAFNMGERYRSKYLIDNESILEKSYKRITGRRPIFKTRFWINFIEQPQEEYEQPDLFSKFSENTFKKQLKSKTQMMTGIQIKSRMQITTGPRYSKVVYTKNIKLRHLFPRGEYGFTGPDALITNIPNFITWKDAYKINVLSFGSSTSYLLEELDTPAKMLLLSTPLRLTDKDIYIKDTYDEKGTKLGVFKYNLPNQLNITKSLTLKLNKEKIFTRDQIKYLSTNVISLLIHSSFYFDLMKKKKIPRDKAIGSTLKNFKRWAKLFSLKFLNEDISNFEVNSTYKKIIDQVYVEMEFSDQMKLIKENIYNIWKILYSTFKEINVNNLKQYRAFIASVFDSKSGKVGSEVNRTDVINNLIAVRNVKFKTYWLTRPHIMRSMINFQRHHLVKQRFYERLNKPSFIIGSSLILSARRNMVFKPEDIDNEINKENAFSIYKNILVDINLFDNIYREMSIKSFASNWLLKRNTMNSIIDNMETERNITSRGLDEVKRLYSGRISAAEQEEAYLKKDVTRGINWG